jgi:hypothetical protein
VGLPTEKRNIFVVRLLNNFGLIKSLMERLNENKQLTRSDFIEIIRNKSKVSGTTIARRASSLIAWFKWISDVTGTFTHKDGAFRID